MALIMELAGGQQKIGRVIQLPRCRERRFQGPQGTRGRVARIREGRQTVLQLARVHTLESLQRHQGFAAHLERRQLGLHPQRQRADGAGVLGNVFAHLAVAARDGPNHAAVLIMNGHR